MNKERFPLSWPEGRPRTNDYQRRQSPFRRPGYGWTGHSMAEVMNDLTREVRLLSGSGLIVSSNVKLRMDGIPYSGQAQPKDPGAAVYFMLKGKPVAFSCDKWIRVECNIYAIAKTIEATRGIERWGSATQSQSFRGFMALPEKSGGIDPYQLLGLRLDCTEEQLKTAYREAAKKWHPDIPGTGSYHKWSEIQDAFNLISQNLRK